VLLTGFEPYGVFSLNPTEEIALSLNGKKIGDGIIRSLVLPVIFEKAFDVLRSQLDEERPPDVIISLGLSPFSSAIHVERIAINLKDYDGIPDNDGKKPMDEPILPDGPLALASTLPISKIVESLNAAGIPARISNSAGTHLCNYIMYRELDFVSRRRWLTRAGFIHVPFVPQQVSSLSARPADTPSLPLEVSKKAIEIAIRVALE
jgi:pyroglutamyl-peptidase